MDVVLIIIAVVVILAALSMEMKLARANRIARATHDLIKEMLAEQKKANVVLQYLNDRAYDAAAKPRPEIGERKPESPEKTPPEPSVYRI